jgi:molybdate transport system substrate-binding protein
MSRLLFALSLLLTIAAAERRAFAEATPADRLRAIEAIYPPWRPGDGSDVADRGLEFTVPPTDVLADFHGSLDNPQLVLFTSGNYFFGGACDGL